MLKAGVALDKLDQVLQKTSGTERSTVRMTTVPGVPGGHKKRQVGSSGFTRARGSKDVTSVE